jgi:hypothetical protein
MLVVQTATATHSIDHQSMEHTELCQAFVTADHAPAVELDQIEIKATAGLFVNTSYHNYSFIRTSSARLSARSPPVL